MTRLVVLMAVAWRLERVRELAGHLLLTCGFAILDTVQTEPLSDAEVERIRDGIERKVAEQNGRGPRER